MSSVTNPEIPTDLIGPHLAQLRAAVAEFITAKVSAEHLVPDLVLIGLMIEVEENADAVRILLASPIPDRAFPSGRAVFEAAQQALLLATHPDYDYAGALAWVYHLRKQHALEDDFEAVVGADPSAEPRPTLTMAVDEMVEMWNDFAPGKGALIRRAQDELEARPRGPDNWLGRNIAKAIDEQAKLAAAAAGIPAPPALAQRNRITYAYLCRGTHPYTRLRPDHLVGDPGGCVRVGAQRPDRASEGKTLEGYVGTALNFARFAMQVRDRRFKCLPR